MANLFLSAASRRLCLEGRLRTAMLALVVAASAQVMAGEIIIGGGAVIAPGVVGPVIAPGGSVSSQNARDLRLKATSERLRGDHDSNTSPNIVIIDGSNAAVGGVNEWWVPTSPAAHGAAYNRARANESRVFLGDDPPPVTVIGVPAAVVAPRPVVTTPQEQSAARNAVRANAYRQRSND